MTPPTRSFADPDRIRLLVLDVDGVLTDGSIVYDTAGNESKQFNVRDGFAMKAWMREGGRLAVITGRGGATVQVRMQELGVTHVFERVADKAVAFEKLLRSLDLDAHEAAMLGDDLPDLPILERCGYPMAVGDAVVEVRDVCAWRGTVPGGRGAAREAIEHLMRASGAWARVVEHVRGVRV